MRRRGKGGGWWYLALTSRRAVYKVLFKPTHASQALLTVSLKGRQAPTKSRIETFTRILWFPVQYSALLNSEYR